MPVSARLNFDRSQVIHEIRKRAQQKETGQLMLAAKSNFISFGFSKGQIISVTHGGKKGMDAVKAIASFIQEGLSFSSLNFIPSATISGGTESLPATEVLISHLEQSSTERLNPTVSNPSSLEIPPAVKKIFEKALTNQIGPMAQIICSSTWSRCDDIKQAMILLSKEIPDPSDQQAFMKEVISKLNLQQPRVR